MSSNRFEKIHQYLHFHGSMNIDPKDKVFKVRPTLDHFNKKFGAFFMPLCNTYSLDEAMEPYYDHHSMKQFIRGKPIRYGFKFWCLTSPEGYMVKFHPYTGVTKHWENPWVNQSLKIFVLMLCQMVRAFIWTITSLLYR